MKSLRLLFIIVLIGFLVPSDSQTKTENELIKKYLENLDQSEYDSQVMPISSKGHGKPVDVECSMYILDIYKVDEVDMEFTADFYFRQFWNDSRLAYPDKDIKIVVLKDAKYIWTPDLFFVQEREGTRHSIVTPNMIIKIDKSGQVFMGLRLTVTFSCPMNFRKYPHDSQKCIFTAESYSLSNSYLEISWNDEETPVGRSDYIELLNFRLTDLKASKRKEFFSSGNSTYLVTELTFQRKVGFFVTRLYLPFVLLIVLSWLSFWIPAKLIAPRLCLLLVVMYLMANIGYDINDHAPKSTYTKGSDVWISVCESLVFASLLEFIAAHIIVRNKEKLKKLSNNDPEDQGTLNSDEKINPANNGSSKNAFGMIANRLSLKSDVLMASRIDKASCVLFPLFFIGFNFVYWIVYCTGN